MQLDCACVRVVSYTAEFVTTVVHCYWVYFFQMDVTAGSDGKAKGLPPLVQPKPKPTRGASNPLVRVNSEGAVGENGGDGEEGREGSNDEVPYVCV